MDEKEIQKILQAPQRYIRKEHWLSQVIDGVLSMIKINNNKFSRKMIREVLRDRFPGYTVQDISTKTSYVLSRLKKQFNIEKKKIYKNSSVLRRIKEFRSNDYDSYSVLMDRNGYRYSKFYKYDSKIDPVTGESILIKRLIGTARHSSDKYFELLDKCDEVKRFSTKKRERQGCYALTGAFSFSRQKIKFVNTVYELLDKAN